MDNQFTANRGETTGPVAQVAATIAWSAAETDAYSEPPFPDDAFCIQMVVLNGERHIYRLNRAMLMQLSNRIAFLLNKPSAEAAVVTLRTEAA